MKCPFHIQFLLPNDSLLASQMKSTRCRSSTAHSDPVFCIPTVWKLFFCDEGNTCISPIIHSKCHRFLKLKCFRIGAGVYFQELQMVPWKIKHPSAGFRLILLSLKEQIVKFISQVRIWNSRISFKKLRQFTRVIPPKNVRWWYHIPRFFSIRLIFPFWCTD